MSVNNIKPIQDEIVLYQSEDGNVKVDVLFQDETVWLTIDQMCLLFGKSRSTINEHILNIYQEGELSEEKSIRKIGNSDLSISQYKMRYHENSIKTTRIEKSTL